MTVPEIKKHVQTLSKKDLENYTVGRLYRYYKGDN